MLRRNGPVVKSVESVLRLEGSLWGERFVDEVCIQSPSYCCCNRRAVYRIACLSHINVNYVSDYGRPME